MSVITEVPKDIPRTQLCRALKIPRHWCYPDLRRRRRVGRTAGQPRKLSPEEQVQTLAYLHEQRFEDQAPRQVHATLLSEGINLASVSTMYRLLGEKGESQPRRGQRPPQRHSKPQLIARAPHEIWTWDITKLPTYTRGFYLSLYVILDLFSRYVVGWMVSRKENAGLAKHLFSRVLERYSIAPDTLIVHQDRGSPMTAHSYTDMMTALGVERSYSRPRVSNDNAFSESQFKTLKYSPSYPKRFDDPEHARCWGQLFFPEYNQRPHGGLALFSPEDVLLQRVEDIATVRQRTLDDHFHRHPERYVHGRPLVARPPAFVAINPDDGIENAADMINRPGALKPVQTPIETCLPEVVT